MLHLHRSNRADGLVEALRALLAAPADDPFAREVVAVPTRGMERWITQQLSARLGAADGRTDGVCANVEFPTPRRLVGAAVAAATGVDPQTDPWLPERSVWPLLDVVDECLSEPWMQLLAAHLGGPAEQADPLKRARRFATVRHVAELFDGYALHRPDTVRAWAASEEAARDQWQGQLWRCLRARIGEPGPAERLERACRVLEAEPEVVELPPQVSVFGLTRLPAGYRDILEALAARRDLHLFLLHPSPALWDKVGAVPAPRHVERKDDPTTGVPVNRLLASWGRDAREMQVVLAGRRARGPPPPGRAARRQLLARIQADVRADEAPAGDVVAPRGRPQHPGPRLSRPRAARSRSCATRSSICCARTRRSSRATSSSCARTSRRSRRSSRRPSARPRPTRTASRRRRPRRPARPAGRPRAAPDQSGARRDRRAARPRRRPGRPPRRSWTSPTTSRCGGASASTTTTSPAARSGSPTSGIRWGLDAAHRRAVPARSRRAGHLARRAGPLLVGVAMTEDEQRLVDGVLPLDDVDSGAIDLAGRLAELVDRLRRRARRALAEAKPSPGGPARSRGAADALTATAERDAWQRDRARPAARRPRRRGTAGASGGRRSALPEVRALLAERLQGRPTRANFRTGHLTVCTLVPMRSVPAPRRLPARPGRRRLPAHGAARRRRPAVERPARRRPRPAHRGPPAPARRADGRRPTASSSPTPATTSARTPRARPRCRSASCSTWSTRTVRADGRHAAARRTVVVRHPLQPFDPRNFTAGALVGRRAVELRPRRRSTGPRPLGATARRRRRSSPRRSAAADAGRRARRPRPLRRAPGAGLPAPAARHRRRRLRRGDRRRAAGRAGRPRAVGVGQRLLDARLAGVDAGRAIAAEMARGHLPPGRRSATGARRGASDGRAIVAEAARRRRPRGRATSVDVRRRAGRRPALRHGRRGARRRVRLDHVLEASAPKHRLAAWVRLLALSAARPERPFDGGDGRPRRRRARRMTVAGIAAARRRPERRRPALARLATLVDLHDRGMREPLPLTARPRPPTRGAAAGGDAERSRAARPWERPSELRPGGRATPTPARARRRVTFDELLAEPPARRRGRGWDADETAASAATPAPLGRALAAEE